MKNERKKYFLESAAEKLLLELAKLVRAFRLFFFRIPEKKMDKQIYIIETIAWLMLTIALVFRFKI
jgi:hypothetical protein